MLPIIPILALLAIVGGAGTLAWYSNLSKQKQIEANQLALRWFGKQFKELAEYQQRKIEQQIRS